MNERTVKKVPPPNRDIDDALRSLLAETPAGVILTPTEIARAVGCSHQYIQQVERRALRKLRRSATLRLWR